MHITRAGIRADILGLGFPLYFFVSELLCRSKVCAVGHSANLWHSTFSFIVLWL